MKEYPILFSGPMVRAILNGTKTQTRRVVKPQPTPATAHPQCKGEPVCSRDGGAWSTKWTTPGRDHPHIDFTRLPLCPYCHPGDRLWVRETWYAWSDAVTGKPVKVMGYKSDIPPEIWDGFGVDDPWWLDAKAITSIHMPRWASRCLLKNTGVRYGRVQDISEEDAMAEGVSAEEDMHTQCHPNLPLLSSNVYRRNFAVRWDSINAKPKPRYYRLRSGQRVINNYISYPWDNIQEDRKYRGKPWYIKGNPWVGIVNFERIKP